MTTSTTSPPSASLRRIVDEGYGPGAWHGADLKAAIADVPETMAFRRPAPGRHSIAEMVLHHAWQVRAVTSRVSGEPEGPFPLQGADWFELTQDGPLDWGEVREVMEREQTRLASVLDDLIKGKRRSPLSETERFDLTLGITCHAIYHTGQIQLLKLLVA